MTRTAISAPNLPSTAATAPAHFWSQSHWRLRFGLILGIFTLVGMLEAGQSIMMQLMSGKSPSGWRALFLGVTDWYMWAALTPFVLWGSQLYPIEQRNWPRRVFFHVFVSILCATAVISLMIPVLELIHRNMDWVFLPKPADSLEVAANLLGLRFVIYLIVYWSIVGVSHAIAYYRKFREREMQTILLESRLAQTQLQML